MGRRIGEILLEHDWVESKVLDRALVKQRASGQRLCSLLIAAGALSVDEAARALGEQHGVLAVLQKHLDGRDPALASRLPAAVARARFALPIGRMGSGALIVCVRDPDPQLAETLARAMSEPVVLAVAPAHVLEALVDAVYPAAAATAPTNPDVEVELDLTEAVEAVEADAATEALVESEAFGALNLVELDDVGVSKNDQGPLVSRRPTRSSLPPATSSRPTRSSLPPATEARPVESPLAGIAISRAVTPTSLAATASLPRTHTPPRVDGQAAIAVGTEPPSPRLVELPRRDGDALSALATAPTIHDVADAAMRFASTRWATALLLAITDGAALGRRGHGPQLSRETVEALTIPLSAASIIKAALEHDAPVTLVPPDTGAVQERLERLLGLPRCPTAIAITVGHRRAYVLAIGDALSDAATAAADLDQLARALGAAFDRVTAS